jgi:hypothetical protein
MANSRHLGLQLHEIAWSAVKREPRQVSIEPADPWENFDGSLQERRVGCLRLLRVYSQMIKVLQRRIDLTVKDALATGSSYGEVASACGVSRQAIRQRWLRRQEQAESSSPPFIARPPDRDSYVRPNPNQPSQPANVRLAGGPRDGERDKVRPGHVTGFAVEDSSAEQTNSPSAIAWYVPSKDDAGVYIFAGLQVDDPARSTERAQTNQTATATASTPSVSHTPTSAEWTSNRLQGARAAKPLVCELATEFGVESKTVMSMLQEMGEFVRSASSTVEWPVARRLREQFAARQATQRPDS